MDGVSSETNEEKDNTERPVRRRHSSILKPPRSPLQDLRGGNELVQESNALRNRKSSRRVSFADTIKVFQAESHKKIVRKSETAETEAGENVPLIQTKNSDENYCEITGMNTLLRAPIQTQTQMQQREFSIVKHNYERKHANDQTVIFSDENQMDLTASHTVMISKGLVDCTKSEKSTKIDTTSFLANLKRHAENSRMKEELKFSMDQNTSSEEKINSNDFIKRLKAGKYSACPTGPDKENSEIPIYSKQSNSASSIHQMHLSLNVDENSSNMTRIFREQDDEMNFTQCHTANIQTLVPTSSEADFVEFKGDNTVYGDDCMDLTANQTMQVLPSVDNLSEAENQTQNIMMDVTTVRETKAPGKKTIFKHKLNAAFQDPFLSPQHKIHITRSHIMGPETQTVSETSNQDARTSAMTSESICSGPAIQGYKTVFYSSCNDAMELTKCLSSMREERNSMEPDGNYSKICPNPDASPLLIEKTIYSGEDSMDITKSHTVAIDNHIFKQDQAKVPITAAPISKNERMLQNHITLSKDGETNVNDSLVPVVSKDRIQQNLTNSLSISLTNRKTELLASEDMDLTKSHTSNLSQAPLASYNLASENITKSFSWNRSPSDKWEHMNKSHIKPSQQPNMIPKNILTDTRGKGKHQILKISPNLSKDSPSAADYNQDITTNHNVAYCATVLDKQMALGNNGSTVSSEQSSFSTTKPLFSSSDCLPRQPAMKNQNTVMSSQLTKSVQGQSSNLPEPLKGNIEDPTPDSSHDKVIICSEEEQTMDLTKSHTVVIGFGSSEVQEFSKSNLGHRMSQLTTVSRQMAIKIENCNKSLLEETGALTFNDNMDVLEDKSVQKSGLLKERQNVKIYERKSVDGLKINKTIVFSEGGENDMDITKSYTVEINHRPLLENCDSHLVPVAGTSKTILYGCGQDEMEITTSHTTALDCKTVLSDDITTRPVEKTVMFVDNYDELEMTKSHTVFIDCQAEEKTVLPDRPNFEISKRKSLQKSKMTSLAEESIFFSENGESNHLAAKDSQLTVLEECSSHHPREGAVTFIADDNMEMSKLTTWKNVKDVQKAGFLNEPVSGKSQRRKSLRLKNDKTIVFSDNDKNDMDVTQSCMVEVNNRSTLEDKEDFNLEPLAGTSKTVLYECGQDDMETTRSHPTALECETVSPDEITTRPVDNTVVFVDNHNDLEVTKSHTVFIDCQATEKVLQEYPKFGIARGKTLSTYFPKNDNCVQEITKKAAQSIENKIVFHPEQKHNTTAPIPTTNTWSRGQGKMEITEFHGADTDEAIGKIVNQAYTSEDVKIESCHLSRTDRKNEGFTNHHIVAIGGSSDNCSSLPNVISSFDNLENNVTSIHYDKNNENASDCPVQNDHAYTDALASEYYLKSERPPLSAPCPLLEKEETIQTGSKGQLDCAIKLCRDQDLIREPKNLLANQALVHSQNLGETTKLNSKYVSFKLPKDQVEAFTYVASQPHLSTQQQQTIDNKDEAILSKAGNSSVSTCEKESKMLGNEKHFAIACKKELKENTETTKCNAAVDFHSNSDLTTQVIQTHANVREASESMIASNAPRFSSVKPNLNNLSEKTEEILDFRTVHMLPPSEQLLELGNKTCNNRRIVQATEIHNVVSNDAADSRDEENKKFLNGAETTSAPLKTAVKDKMRRCSLGIFLPRLPNRRNCSVTGVDDLEQISVNTADISHLENQPISSKDTGTGAVAAKLNLSPSQYINEENLPVYSGEINSSDSISIEIEEKALVDTYQKEILLSESKMEDTYNIQKRSRVQQEDAVPHEKKMRKDEIKLADTTQDQEGFDHCSEEDMDKNVYSVLAKSLSRTPSSCSSSLDSVKADGTSLDFSTNRNSQMESQFLSDSVCEESLREKLKDGSITIREFFTLLQVHILIQKPRQSNLPGKFAINTSPTPEDLMLRQYVYGPKIQLYREDCEVLRQKIEELKVSAMSQDKLLTDVNRNLWEKMRHCSDEELKAFGTYLNKIKSCSTKMTKVFTHQGKVALYSKLVQSAQNEREKLQMRINEMDKILMKINNCLAEVEIETKNLEDEEKDNPMEEQGSEMRAAEKELEQLKAEEEQLQRKLLELEVQKKQTLAHLDSAQNQINRTEKLLDQLSLSEWDVTEWSDDQAVFTFVYDTIELTITFGEPVEDRAPPSSLLVHKLIFQYIEDQESWKEQCTSQHQVPQMLQELSLVVNHCRLLGEEIEFLKRWGPNYNLMDIDVKNTELRLLFSSSAAFAKFEITLSLSAHYPLVPIPFTIQNHLGNTGHDEIATIISKVPLEDNYLKNVVKQIYQVLLRDCHFYC
ncbi:outer kinetochore KNL1 complex subunit KNL1 isoform X2 [Castor canadensis]|uniref:Outer kinetochore KNL1 complex subunit KNL1 isoform X2 n=1 Tax=Castor canadensis TaxID=51338 RepID=A0AC58LXD6_CASCN